MVDYALYGSNPLGYHWINLIFHLANAVILFLVLQAMTAARWESAIVAALFALHPLHVESVAWIAERKTVLSAFFGLLTIWAYHRYTRKQCWQTYIPVLLLYALALMAKPVVVTWPFLLLLLDYWPLGRLASQGLKGELHPPSPPLARCILEKIPLLLLSGSVCVVTYLAQQDVGFIKRAGLDLRVGNALVSYAAYMAKAIWPAKLGVMYPYPPDPFPLPFTVGAALAIGAVAYASARYATRYPYVFVGCLWYLIAFIPMIGFVRIGEHAIADRYAYIPLTGVFVMSVWWVSSLYRRWRHRHRAVALAMPTLAVLSLLVFQTSAQAGYWRDSISLFKHTLAVTRDNCLVHNDLGTVLRDSGRLSEAAYHYREALRIWPGYAKALKNLADVLDLQGNSRRAELLYLRALEHRPDYLEGYNNLSQLYFRQGKYDEAVSYLRTALDMAPDRDWLHSNLATALAAGGQPDQAQIQYSRALQIDAGNAETHFKFGVLLVSVGEERRALDRFSEAILLDPDNAGAYHHVGTLFARAGRLKEAYAFFKKALQLNPRLGAWEDLHRIRRALAHISSEPNGRPEEALSPSE